MRLAIFGDLHGRILLAFWLVKRWQEEHGKRIDQILCTGDVGIYPAFERMDKASRRFAEKYPEELGFSKLFFAGDQSGILRCSAADEILQEVEAKLFFVAGNHEDHEFIRQVRYQYGADLRPPCAIDIDWEGVAAGSYADDDFRGYGRILSLPEGPIMELEGDLSGISREPGTTVRVRAINGLEKFTPAEAWEAPGPGTADILLSHEAPRFLLDNGDERGSERLLQFSRRLSPKWHFFGHLHRHVPAFSVPSELGADIRCIGMNQLFSENKESIVTQGAFGILEGEGEGFGESSFAMVEDPWYRTLRYAEVARFL
jgi:Icc-related predicted phosphoesterase